MIYLYLFGTCFHFIYVFMIIVKYFFVMKLNNNDDSHNSGLNLLIYNMLLDIGSHPAWVCGLKLCVCQWYIP